MERAARSVEVELKGSHRSASVRWPGSLSLVGSAKKRRTGGLVCPMTEGCRMRGTGSTVATTRKPIKMAADVSRVERNGRSSRKPMEDEEEPGEEPEPDGDGGSGEHVGFEQRRKLSVDCVKRREGRKSLKNVDRDGQKRSGHRKDGPDAHVEHGRSDGIGRGDQNRADPGGGGQQRRKQSGAELGERRGQGTTGPEKARASEAN